MRAEIYIDHTAPCPGKGTIEEPFCNMQIVSEQFRDWQHNTVLFWGTLAILSTLALVAIYMLRRRVEPYAIGGVKKK